MNREIHGTLTACGAIISARLRALMQYRAAAWAGLTTQLFWGYIRMMIMEAFFRSSKVAQPLNYGQVVTYIWLGQAFFAMLPYSINPDPEIRDMIRSGAVAYELARPIDLYLLWFCRSLAARMTPMILRTPPILVISYFLFQLQAPVSPGAAIAWVLTTIGALLLASVISTIVTILMMWTVSGDGMARLFPSLAMIASGMIIPLPFFPAYLQPLLNALPFRGMMDVPFRLYMGSIPLSQLPAALLQQWCWILILVCLGRLLLMRGVRRLAMQGG